MPVQEVFPEVSGDLAEKSFLVKTDRLMEMKVDNEVKPYITKQVSAPLDTYPRTQLCIRSQTSAIICTRTYVQCISVFVNI